MNEDLARIGDRIRSNKYPGVSGIVDRIETTDHGKTVYFTQRGFWYSHEVTVERTTQSEEERR